MEQFIRLKALAAPLMRPNVNTDVIIPSLEITSPSREGFGEKLFASWRYTEPGRKPNPDFVLNRAPFDRAQILIAGENFGCGSSREMAVWAIRQFGFRCVIAPSFGTIFQSNCYRNGVLPVVLPKADVEALGRDAESGRLELEVDLEACTVTAPGGRAFGFDGRQARARDAARRARRDRPDAQAPRRDPRVPVARPRAAAVDLVDLKPSRRCNMTCRSRSQLRCWFSPRRSPSARRSSSGNCSTRAPRDWPRPISQALIPGTTTKFTQWTTTQLGQSNVDYSWENPPDGATFRVYGRGPRMSANGTGTWSIADNGRYCWDIMINREWKACRFIFKVGDAYYMSPSANDRAAKAIPVKFEK